MIGGGIVVRGTTQGYLLNIKKYDLSKSTVYVTIDQHGHKITKNNSDLQIMANEDGTKILFTLSQEDTLFFDSGVAYIQVRFINKNGRALATKKKKIDVYPVLQKGVIQYGAE